MFARVEFWYTNGVERKPHREALGQLHSEAVNGKMVLQLKPLDWSYPGTYGLFPPLAELHSTTFGYILHRTLIVQGYECIVRGKERQWVVQRWDCDLIERDFAMQLANPPKKITEIPSIYATAKA